ncbi:LuxR C-terminal-related transcriptional regulator, partial [Enterobacter hormaechei]|uniref:LuxR C-terminal-related transcriptional regulator n=1 Tax=Enterobacter hormaechei TaxID=158836 RepID=UPI0030762C01
DRNRSHWSTSKTPSYTKSVSWQHHPKTVSSHKGNIKRKIKTHNKQVIYHVVRLTDNVTNGIFVNMR